jgi:hypothetical protein
MLDLYDEKERLRLADAIPPPHRARRGLRLWASALFVAVSVSLSALVFLHRPCHHINNNSVVADPTVTIGDTIFRGKAPILSGYHVYKNIRYAYPA